MVTGPVEPVVDVHTHFADVGALRTMADLHPEHAAAVAEDDDGYVLSIPPGWFDFAPEGVTRRVPEVFVDPEARLDEMRRQGVTCHALGGWVSLNFYRVAGPVAAEFHHINNDAMIALAKRYEGSFVALPGLPMQEPAAAAEEVRRVAGEDLVGGVNIGTNIDGVDLDDPRFEPVWEALDAASLPILVHPPGEVAAAERLSGYQLKNLIGNPVDTTVCAGRIVFSGLLDRHPNLRFCFVHGGGFMPYQIGRWDHGWATRAGARAVIAQRPSSYVPSRLYFDTITHDDRAFTFLCEQVGVEQVVVGSDFPWDMGTADPLSCVTSSALPEEDKRMIVSDNAITFLRWPRSWPQDRQDIRTGERGDR